MELTPLIFEPLLVPKVWGGRRLEKYGKTLSPGARIGESWELFDSPGQSAVVAEGPLRGRELNAIMHEHGPRLLGQAEWERQPDRFPLMIKLLDASQDLSLQVHPDDDLAAQLEGPEQQGKDELFVVLEAEPGARVTAGLKPGVSAQDFAAALRRGEPGPLLNSFEVRPGDVVDLPAGCVHALGKGCVVAEIEQNSELTYRAWDWGRLEDGKPRALHLDKALRALRPGGGGGLVVPQPQPGGQVEGLIRRGSYEVRRLSLEGTFRPRHEGGYHLLLGLTGQAVLESPSASAMMVTPGRAVLVPASVDFSLKPLRERAQVLWTTPPPRAAHI